MLLHFCWCVWWWWWKLLNTLCKTRKQCSKSETKLWHPTSSLCMITCPTWFSHDAHVCADFHIFQGSILVKLTWQCVKFLLMHAPFTRETFPKIKWYATQSICIHAICSQLSGNVCILCNCVAIAMTYSGATYLSVSATTSFWLNLYCWERLPSSEADRTNTIWNVEITPHNKLCCSLKFGFTTNLAESQS